jgi:hypothetical protein
MPIRHSSAGGNPGAFELDSRLRWNDDQFAAYMSDIKLK